MAVRLPMTEYRRHFLRTVIPSLLTAAKVETKLPLPLMLHCCESS